MQGNVLYIWFYFNNLEVWICLWIDNLPSFVVSALCSVHIFPGLAASLILLCATHGNICSEHWTPLKGEDGRDKKQTGLTQIQWMYNTKTVFTAVITIGTYTHLHFYGKLADLWSNIKLTFWFALESGVRTYGPFSRFSSMTFTFAFTAGWTEKGYI